MREILNCPINLRGKSVQEAKQDGDSVWRRGPNEWSQPHSNPNERFITVLAGTFLIGMGEKFDKINTVAVGRGGVIHDIPNQMHYDGTGPEGATLEFIAMGPAARN